MLLRFSGIVLNGDKVKKIVHKTISVLCVVVVVFLTTRFYGLSRILLISLGLCVLVKIISATTKARYCVLIPILLTFCIFIRYLAYGGSYELFIISTLVLIVGEVICLLSKGSRLSNIFISIWCLAFYLINAIMYVGWYFQYNYGKLWFMEKVITVFVTGLCLMSISFDQNDGMFKKL